LIFRKRGFEEFRVLDRLSVQLVIQCIGVCDDIFGRVRNIFVDAHIKVRRSNSGKVEIPEMARFQIDVMSRSRHLQLITA